MIDLVVLDGQVRPWTVEASRRFIADNAVRMRTGIADPVLLPEDCD